MPTITIRVSDVEKTSLELAAQRSGQNISDYVRRTLELREAHENDIGGLNVRVEELWRRTARLEELAGL